MNTNTAIIALFLSTFVAASLSAARFPSVPWSELKVERDGAGNPRIVDSSGKTVLHFYGEKAPEALPLVKLEVADDHLEIDVRPACARGMGHLVMSTAGIDPDSLGGDEAVMKTTWSAPRWCRFDTYFEGHSKEGRHFYTSRDMALPSGRRTYAMIKPVDAGLKELHLRFDVGYVSDCPVSFYGAEYGRKGEIEVPTITPEKPRQLFYAPFDDSADAAKSAGDGRPLRSEGIEFTDGFKGRAVRLTAGARSVLAYSAKENVRVERGTVSMWCKREWQGEPGEQGRTLFALEEPKGHERRGSGQLWLWWWGKVLRGDRADYGDTYSCRDRIPLDAEWHHVVYCYSEEGVQLYVDGQPGYDLSDSWSPLGDALKMPDLLNFDRCPFASFFVGGQDGSRQIDGCIDELRILSEPLNRQEVWRLYERELGDKRPKEPDYASLLGKGNPWESPEVAAVPGVPERELVQTIRLDSVPGDGSRFRFVGEPRIGELGGVKYLEAGRKAGNRWAVGFTVDPSTPLYSIEIDYPDDAVRTADFIIQRARNEAGDYTMQVGYATGGEYENTGKILTHRVMYWATEPELALIAMTARDNAPAAVSEIRIYRVKDSKLPSGGVKDGPAVGGWNRVLAMYFEDPAIGFDFGARRTFGHDLDELELTIDRAAALMKFTGENFLLYPGSWYHGPIGREYNPRNHADGYLAAWYEKFDREGLFFVPTINEMDMPVSTGLLSYEKMCDGSLHDSPIAILDTGRPNWGRWHGSPPNFNIFHPAVQNHIMREVEAFISQGAEHPSFKGVCFHVVPHNLLSWGCLESGYNDYAVRAFERDTGVKVPVDRKAADRGRLYAEWLKAHALEKWIGWRCDQTAKFYAKVAKRLKSARSDLRLVLDVFSLDITVLDEPMPADIVERYDREAGIDPKEILALADNVVFCQTAVPAHFRYAAGPDRKDQKARNLRERAVGPFMFEHLKNVPQAWFGQHDLYWESPIGAAGPSNTLTCEWLNECGWRVSTINPSGRHALEQFVKPLKYGDVTGMTKGGFLVGTYGMESVLVPFARAFRALPAVKFGDLPSSDAVRLRHADFAGESWFYIVNTEYASARVTLSAPKGSVDLVTGEDVSGKREISLEPYEMRSFRAPSGLPAMKTGKAN